MKKISRRLLSVLLIIAMLIPTGLMGITSTAENTTFNDGDIIEFGSYPQSQITDEKLIETLASIASQWKSYGYYSGDGKGNAIAGDWMQYKDITLDGEKYRAVKIINNKPNYITDVTPTTASHQLSNGFVAGEIYWFKYEPIKWIVLDSESGYVMSLYAIDAQPFTNDIQNGNNYSLSTLRTWLNEDFYYTAFASSQDNLLEKNNRDNTAIKSDFDSEDTYDKVTLLSYTEAKNYGYNRGRVKTTDYASSQGAPRHGGYNGCSDWWLRTAGSSGRVACCMIDIYIRTFFDDVTFASTGIRPCININFNAKSEMQTPAGYNFYEDSYQFDNGTTTISKKYFTTLFGEEQGKLLYKKKKKAGGVCFGMAYTTAAFYQGLPSLSVNVRNLDTKTTIHVGNNSMSVYDYIVYSYIYQFCSDEWEIIKAKSEQLYAPDLVSTVKYFLQNNVLVPITMWRLKKNSKNTWDVKRGHAVLAVGIEGNKILVDDPNNENDYEYIEIDSAGKWYFSGLSWKSEISEKEVCMITYSLNVDKPYQLLASGTHTTVHSNHLEKNTSANVLTETYVEGMQKLDTDKLLMYVDSDEYSIDSENLIEINGVIGTDETAETDAESLYWVSEDKTVTVSDIKGENNEIIVAGNDVSVSVNTQDSSVVTLTVDEENNDVSAKINSTQGNQYTISFESTDDSENDITTTLTGTANGTEVTATETNNGVQVTGLNNITATYETADGTDTEDIEIENGETVNIVVNDEENSVDVEWNCSHLCHNDNAFMQFIWKIINFLSKIFGVSQYCDCGMKHW